MGMKITGEDIVSALREQEADAESDYLTRFFVMKESGCGSVVIDGVYDLDDIAERLNKKASTWE